MIIQLKDKISGTHNFTWGEALWLRQWSLHAFPPDDVCKNIVSIAQVVQKIRDYYGKPIYITSWFRPDKYNELVGGAPQSWHRMGGAVDFVCDGVDSNEVREYLEPKLVDLDIRMELGTPHIHIDNKPVKPHESRTFNP